MKKDKERITVRDFSYERARKRAPKTHQEISCIFAVRYEDGTESRQSDYVFKRAGDA